MNYIYMTVIVALLAVMRYHRQGMIRGWISKRLHINMATGRMYWKRHTIEGKTFWERRTK